MKRRIERVDLQGPVGRLEALLLSPAGPPRATALVCHPHPLHGGSMHTKAVYRTARGLESAGCSVLRFNFRGVGHSEGHHDDGRGELEDARTALRFLLEQHPGLPVLLGGFSFGSSIGLRLGAQHPDVHALLGIGVPLTLDSFDFLVASDKPVLLLAGSEDPFCPGAALRDLQSRLGRRAQVVILEGAGHLLTERLDELQRDVQDFASRIVPPRPLA